MKRTSGEGNQWWPDPVIEVEMVSRVSRRWKTVQEVLRKLHLKQVEGVGEWVKHRDTL